MLEWVVGIGFALLFLFKFPKQFGILIAVLAVIAGAVGLYYWWQAEQAKRDRTNLVSLAYYSTEVCNDPKYPIAIEFANRTGKTVRYVSFQLTAHQEGYSLPVYTHYQTWDRIMKPGLSYSACWALSSYKTGAFDNASVLWDVELHSVTFE